MLNSQHCELFDIPFFQFSQMKKFCSDEIPLIKAKYKTHWETWKALNLAVSRQLGQPFAPPHIEKWCNGWQVRAHFFAYYKYEFYQNSAAILSVILNRRRLSVSLDWHCYRESRSQINLSQYNQWLDKLDWQRDADFDLWAGAESEYSDFRSVKIWQADELIPSKKSDFWCIGRNVEKADLANINAVNFIANTISELVPFYEACHQ
ncbi:glucose-6-phosphate dehydrogenase-like protein [Nicoletella semolina]|uniref:Glucose-6-phosphate dehydrogenase-like protein n=1 Tax=Nicoletella semolina TaxID=271160 RepID=A0A4R2N8M3_9PAST|nr:HI_0552 family protein [Nicoletella semolina]MDH2924535.1 hypothetical protein [Nicoletella semolina]TCP17337.1 glucose-6-phosphate dehydrogenase-like protein [Nicoletella semolina]